MAQFLGCPLISPKGALAWYLSHMRERDRVPLPHQTILCSIMLISEAMVMLAPCGVERIDRIPNDSCQVWRVTQNGAEYLYAAALDRVVWALTAANDWEV